MRKEESFADVLGFGGGTDGRRRSPPGGGGSALSSHSGPGLPPSFELGIGGGCERGCVEALGTQEAAEEVQVAVRSREEVSMALEDGSETAEALTDAATYGELQRGATGG